MRATVFERSGAVGGRLASVRTEAGSFDVGAQFLTIRSDDFAQQVRDWAERGLVCNWDTPLAELSGGHAVLVRMATSRYVGVPSMQSIADGLARGLELVLECPVGRISRAEGQWSLFDPFDMPVGGAAYDGVVLAMPSVDALPLAQGNADFAERLRVVRWDACWTAMLSLLRPATIDFDAAFIHDDPILAWVARETSKPQRLLGDGVAETWLLQARASWSNHFIDLAPDEAARWMQRAFAARVGRALAQKSCTALCWRAATPADTLSDPYLWDAQRAIGAAGDWCGGAHAESAYLSGQSLARAILASAGLARSSQGIESPGNASSERAFSGGG